VLDFDRKRIHAGCEFTCPRVDEPVAVAELMLLHVHQGEKPTSAVFPAEVQALLESLKLPPAALAAWGPRSRTIELKRR
jgi:acyl-CoA thioesterase FadM